MSSIPWLHPHSSDGMEFPCGHVCESTYLIVALRSVTSLIGLLYAAFLFKRRNNDRPFVIVRLSIMVNLLSRVIAAVTPSTLGFIIVFSSLQNIALYYAVFEWHKMVVDSSYKAVKVSLTSPRWNIYFTRVQQALLFLIFPLTYGFGADPSGNPLCNAVQAFNRTYRIALVISVFISLIFCNSVVHRAVMALRAQNKSSGANEGMQRRFAYALRKIRKILATICLVVTVNLISFALAFRSTGAEPAITCFKTSSDLLGGLSGGVGGLLLLWVTDTNRPALGSSTGTTKKSVSSDSDEDGLAKKVKRIKTYTEMQAEKSRQSNAGFSASMPPSPRNGALVSSMPPSPRNGGFTTPSVPASPRNGGFTNPSVPASPQNFGFTTPPQQASPRNGGFTNPSSFSNDFTLEPQQMQEV